MTTPAAVVFGARNLGGTVIERLLAEGWQVAGVARSADTLAGVRARGALAVHADLREPGQVADALRLARDKFGRLDLVVNATTPAQPSAGELPGGGPVADAGLEAFRRWSATMAECAFVFLSESVRALRAGDGGGCLVQIVDDALGPPHGLLIAGYGAVRALVAAAAPELRVEGIRACLLTVRAPLDSPPNAARLVAAGVPADAAVHPEDVANAVTFLAGQGRRGVSYEIALTSAGAR